MLWQSSRLVGATVIGLMVLGGLARAGVLNGLPAVYGPGTPQGVPAGETVIVNNDNVGEGNPNRISLVGIDIKGLAPIDIRVPVANSPGTSGTTEYFLTLGTAANMTTSAWTGFEIELGSGIGDEFLRLSALPIPGVDSLDFDTPDRDPAVTSSSFPAISHGAHLLTFSGGLVPVGGVASAQNFSIDIPDTTNVGSPTYNFTIRLRPVPLLGGDFDEDGDVDGKDFLTWQRNRNVGQLSAWRDNYGGGGFSEPGDFDGDGDVDGRDFLVWQRNPSVGALADWKTNYGAKSVAVSTEVGGVAARSVAVPEPPRSIVLIQVLTIGWVAIGGGRRG